MIQVLCASCNTHLMNTDVGRLDWPLAGEMFDVIYPGWWLRPGLLNLDIFCPACGSYPFFWDGSVPGAVGKNLNVRGADGKPAVMTIKQILMGLSVESVGCQRVPVQATSSPTFIAPEEGITHSKSERIARSGPSGGITGHQGTHSLSTQSKPPPCPSCGAKPSRGGVVSFHKKGCQTKVLQIIHQEEPVQMSQDEPAPAFIREMERHRKIREANPDPAGLMAPIEAAVKSGPDREDTPPTPGELAEIERGREARREKPEAKLRPGEGYGPKPEGVR